MSRQEALEQYARALKMGKKYYKSALSRGQHPYPPVLDDIIDESSVAGRVNIGIVDIPSKLIVGVKTDGRISALAGNFMPLLAPESEFGSKWISLCEAHLSDEGIRDPIKCFEYMGRFYVQEGNKRVSVLKSYNAPNVSGNITRIIPEYSDDLEVQVYYEFMHFYRLSHTYLISFRKKGQYAKLQALLGFDGNYEWSESERLSFSAGFLLFEQSFNQANSEKINVTAEEAFLVWLSIYCISEIRDFSLSELVKSILALWTDIKALTVEDPIEVSTSPETHEKGIISKLLDVTRTEHLNIAFIYAFNPEVSEWTRAHDHGREYLEQSLKDKVTVRVYNAFSENYYEKMLQAVEDGAQVIFATTPHMIDSCRRIAAEHQNIKVLNCSLSQPYTGVRMYYGRIYEGKFITGAVAGAMAKSDTVGYIANYPIFGVPASINAFALGVRMTNPRARIKLGWTCLPGDPLGEFINEEISVISNRDATNPVNSHWALEWGTYIVSPDGSMIPLAVPCWHWGHLYEKVIKSIFSGAWNEMPQSRAINYWWGMDSGVTDVQLSETLPDGVHTLAEILKSGIMKGSISPFNTRIFDQNGVLRGDGVNDINAEEIMKMDWLCDNVDGHIPSFDELLPQSQGLVRLLGTYRSEILPQKELLST